MAAANGAVSRPSNMMKRTTDGREAELLIAIYNKLQQIAMILSTSTTVTP